MPERRTIPLLFYVYLDRQAKWRWRLFSSAGMRIIAISGESYSSKEDCIDSIDLIVDGAMRSVVIEEPEPEDEED